MILLYIYYIFHSIYFFHLSVKPEKISDDQMTVLARDIADRVENEMEYPGQIKVNLIREKRVADYAK